MAYNSYVLIPKGLEAPERAKLLGHSVETNLRYYTYVKSDDYIDELRHILDGDSDKITEISSSDEVSTPQYPTLIDFTKRKRTPKTSERRGWDSNPRALSDKRFSRPPRYDHFDTSPDIRPMR